MPTPTTRRLGYRGWPPRKLNEQTVAQIKAMRRQGVPQAKVAALFGVSQMTISRVDRGVHWRNAAPEKPEGAAAVAVAPSVGER